MQHAIKNISYGGCANLKLSSDVHNRSNLATDISLLWIHTSKSRCIIYMTASYIALDSRCTTGAKWLVSEFNSFLISVRLPTPGAPEKWVIPQSLWRVFQIRSSLHTDAAHICWIDKTCDELVTVEPCYSKPLKCGHLAFPLTAVHYKPLKYRHPVIL